MESLFKDVGTITKIAGKKISDEPENWPQEIKQYLLEQAPYTGRYDLVVNFKRMDEEVGHAMGFVDISAGTGESSKQARIPFVVEDKELKPMDLLITNQTARPLTEGRLSEALFRPQMFDSVVKQDDIKPTGLVDSGSTAQPPARFGGTGSSSVKFASLLTEIKDTILEEDLSKTAGYIASFADIRASVLNNPATLQALNILHEAETTEKTASSLSSKVTATVMQISLTKEGKYKVKTANPKAYSPEVEDLDRGHALAKLGSDVVRLVDNAGVLTVSTDSLVDKDKMEAKYASVENDGIYKAIGMDGNPIKGVVFTKVAMLDGASTGIKIFANVDHVSFQNDFVGEKLASLKQSRLPSATPRGMGVFYWSTDQGVKTTVPLVVNGISKMAGEEKFDVYSLMDEHAILTKAAVKDITKLGEEVLIPNEAAFMSLPGDSVVPLSNAKDVSSRRGHDKTAKVRIRAHNDRFSFDGGCGLDKIASTDMDWNDAVFLSTCLGMNPEFAETKLAQAIKYVGGTTVRGLSEVRPLEDFVEKAREKLATLKDPLTAHLDKIRQNLWKEAAEIEDAETVDKMLSLNYINPENIRKFIEYLPTLETAQRKLSELLLASRIGLKAIDENSVSNAIRGMEQAIEGLRVLMHTKES